MMKARPYRGKYPNKIKSVSSAGQVCTVCVNNGARYTVAPLNAYGRKHMPRVGDFIHELALTDAYLISAVQPC